MLIPGLESRWTFRDYMGALMVRSGIGRTRYRVNPGIYRIGSPDRKSPVFVTANYKLTLDHLRKNLCGIDGWILVLDTDGINVWCAAGKGTFGTEELIKRISRVGLADLVDHRKLILPQLGAPGITPGQVKRETGFTVYYGPVEARDLPRYLEKGMQADASMRRKEFPLPERLAVSLTHFVQSLPHAAILTVLFSFTDALFMGSGALARQIGENTVLSLGAGFTGSLLAGALLPLLPGRAFSLKGLFLGILYVLALQFMGNPGSPAAGNMYSAGKSLLLLCWIVYQVLNLTGSSTYTSLSGVRKEMKLSIPLLLAGCAGSLALITAGGILS